MNNENQRSRVSIGSRTSRNFRILLFLLIVVLPFASIATIPAMLYIHKPAMAFTTTSNNMVDNDVASNKLTSFKSFIIAAQAMSISNKTLSPLNPASNLSNNSSVTLPSTEINNNNTTMSQSSSSNNNTNGHLFSSGPSSLMPGPAIDELRRH